MAEILDEDDYQRLKRWFLELFSPVTEPTRRGKASVRFGLGEFDLPGMIFSRWAVVRDLVWALQEVAPTAWSELKVLAQESVDEKRARWARPDEPDRLDQLYLAQVATLCKEEGLSLTIAGLRSQDEKTLRSARKVNLRIGLDPRALQAWRATWNLADDRSLFTVALVLEAIDETDLGRKVPAEVIPYLRSRSLVAMGWVPVPSAIPGVEPKAAGALETALPSPYPQAFRFETPHFKPLMYETAATFKGAARQAFEREINAHIATCRASLSAQEVARVPVKRVSDDHFRWYIRFQVLGQSLDEVSEAEDAKKGTVSLAIDDLVKLVGVPRRERKRPGRPRKKNPPSPSENTN